MRKILPRTLHSLFSIQSAHLDWKQCMLQKKQPNFLDKIGKELQIRWRGLLVKWYSTWKKRTVPGYGKLQNWNLGTICWYGRLGSNCEVRSTYFVHVPHCYPLNTLVKSSLAKYCRTRSKNKPKKSKLSNPRIGLSRLKSTLQHARIVVTTSD